MANSVFIDGISPEARQRHVDNVNGDELFEQAVQVYLQCTLCNKESDLDALIQERERTGQALLQVQGEDAVARAKNKAFYLAVERMTLKQQ